MIPDRENTTLIHLRTMRHGLTGLVVAVVFSFSVSLPVFPQSASLPAYVNDPPAPCCIVSDIQLAGNRRTKENIILRELTFSKADTLLQAEIPVQMQRSRENLLNTPLFNYVNIDTIWESDGRLAFKIVVEERWYTWPYILFDFAGRNFNSWWKDRDLNTLNYGVMLEQYNFRGRNERLSVVASLGYERRLGLRYFDIALDRRQRHLLGIGTEYSLQHKLAYNTIGNELVYAEAEQQHFFSSFSTSVNYIWRPGIYVRHEVDLMYQTAHAGDTLLTLNPLFFANGSQTGNALALNYAFSYLKVDLASYPLRGVNLNVSLNKTGFNLLDNEPDFGHAQLSLKTYQPLKGRFGFANLLYYRHTFGTRWPYFYQRGLGYSTNFVRGYEYYIVNGQRAFLTRNILRYNLLKTTVKEMRQLPLSKFNKIHYALYLNLNFDAGYVASGGPYAFNPANDLVDQWMVGGGIGLDFVTYYDKIVRFEFSLNRLRQAGFFVHFEAPL